jgi:hypothetical protein
MREKQGEKEVPKKQGQEGQSAEVREEEVGMNLGGEREDLAPITGEIGNLAKEIIPVEANETP